MKILINRIRIKECTTDGILSINGVRICDTAEPTASRLPAGTYDLVITKCPKNKRKIPIVKGYRYCEICTFHADAVCRLRMSEYDNLSLCPFPESSRAEIRAFENDIVTKSRTRIAMLDYDSCPRIIPGNGVFNCDDSRIIVGRYLSPGIVTYSRDVFDHLYDRIEKAIARGKSVQLIINE